MGSALPYRIELADDVIDTLRTFDVDTQRTVYRVNEVRLLPARGVGGQALWLPPSIAAGAGATSGHEFGRPGLLLAALWLCLVFAAAGPQRLVSVPDRTASGRDIVLALDLSGSMAIEDFSLDGENASRLDAVKRVAARFVEARRGDRVGLVTVLGFALAALLSAA